MNSFNQIFFSIMVVWSVAGFQILGFAQQDAETEATEPVAAEEDRSQWQYRALVTIPAADVNASEPGASKPLIDFFVPPDILGHARSDLGDLRILQADGSRVPYALRVLLDRTIRDTIVTSEFNRSEPEEGVHELALELLIDETDHNEVVVQTSGTNFRRQVTVSGSDDGKDWKPLVSGIVFRFTVGSETSSNESFVYPSSRHRFVRVQVTPDPESLALEGEQDQFTFESVTVLRNVLLQGQQVSSPTMLSDREPTRYAGSAASRWIVDFGESIPCERLEIDVQDQDFVRDVTLEMETANVLGQAIFVPVYLDQDSVWQRRPGDAETPMELKFSEVQTKRLRITVTDSLNKPLTLTGARGFAAARQIVFERPQESDESLQLYFGNFTADNPNYDFARNLPESLPQAPVRAVVTAAEPNPQFVSPPKPWTERFPWLIYVVLASVSVVLGAVIFNLSRAAIASHDSAAAAASGV